MRCGASDGLLLRLFFAEQEEWIDGEGALCGEPGGDQPQESHGENYSDEHERIARRGLKDDVRQHSAGEDAED